MVPVGRPITNSCISLAMPCHLLLRWRVTSLSTCLPVQVGHGGLGIQKKSEAGQTQSAEKRLPRKNLHKRAAAAKKSTRHGEHPAPPRRAPIRPSLLSIRPVTASHHQSEEELTTRRAGQAGGHHRGRLPGVKARGFRFARRGSPAGGTLHD